MKPLLILLLVCVSGASYAQSSPRFSIARSIVAGGGATNSSARFQLTDTAAQPLAAVPSSARFSIQGGFWIRPTPIFFAPTKLGTNFLVSIQSEPGKTYTVQYQSALGSGWQNLSNILGDGSIITVSNAAAGASQKFYRLIEQ